MKRSGSTPAFSLTEILAATAILSVMFAIMFGILQQTSRGWQAANRKVEASQVARMALDQIARDIGSAVAVATNNLRLPNGLDASYGFGFVHLDSAATLTNVTLPLTPPNDLLFVVTSDAGSSSQGQPDLAEAGYFSVHAASQTNNMEAGHYYLIRHWYPAATNSDYDILSNPLGWESTPAQVGGTSKRQVFVDNCLRFDVRFLYSPTTGPAGVRTNNTWGRPQTNGAWGPAGLHPADAPAGLPREAQITLCVLDERTAQRLARIEPNGLSAEELGKIPDQLDQITSGPVKATLREGLTTFRRRVTFQNGQP